MRKILIYFALTILMFLVSTATSFASSNECYIVHYSSQQQKQFIKQSAQSVLDELDELDMLIVEMNEQQLMTLQQSGHIFYYEKNQTYQMASEFKVANLSTSESDRWNLKAIEASEAWQSGYTGKGVKIAVIDSGIENHSDLTIAGGVSFVGESYRDDHGHGTHVAGIIAANHNGFGTAGIAPNAEIYAVKSIKSDGFGDVSDVLKGIDWAIEHEMDIINLSFGDLEESQALYEGVLKAINHGILVVAASGNEGTASGTGNTLNYPARHEEVISVGAIDRHFARADFSGTGPTNDFAAPGVEIYSTYLNGQYATYNGTSMAAPHITGLLALLKEQYPYLSAAELREALVATAQDLGTPGFDEWYGYGLPKYKQVDNQKVAQLFAEAKSMAQLQQQVNQMPKGLEKLALQNKLNETQEDALKQLDEAFQVFIKSPSAKSYDQIEAYIAQLITTELQQKKQQQLEAIIVDYMTPAEKAVKAFEKNKSVVNYKRAATELEKLIELPQKQKLSQQLEALLHEFAKTAITALDNYKKKPTQDGYDFAKLTISNLPLSTIRDELLISLDEIVKRAQNKAGSAVAVYEKQQTLTHYQAALKLTKAVHDEALRVDLENRLQKVVTNVTKKAKTRVENYEKKKTKANRELALKVVKELPDSKEKSNLMKRLK